jgi:uncharacterized C2H2 Zn-finger protein
MAETDVETPAPPNIDEQDDDGDDDGCEWVECCCCGMEFRVSRAWVRHKRASGMKFFCPNGHNLHYPRRPARDAELEKAKTEALTAKSKAEQLEAKLEDATGRKWPWQK